MTMQHCWPIWATSQRFLHRYSACFGTELAMNNQLATHFRTYFQMDAADASALAGAFGLMNLFARPVLANHVKGLLQ